MPSYTLSEIWIYPVKSLGGIRLQESFATERGLQYDRRWMLIDIQNRFLSQRELPEMALILPEIVEENGNLIALKFSHKLDGSKSYFLHDPTFSHKESKKILATVWDDTVQVIEVEDDVNNWLSDTLGQKCKLVFMPNEAHRKVDKKYAITGQEVTSLSDGYPFLIIGEESLKLLNSKLEEQVPINRFRPNFVFKGGEPHDEDLWGEFFINDVQFFGVKNCARCPVPNIDQATALQSKEPIKTLSQYRKFNKKVYFGQNLLIGKTGKVSVGDIISFHQ